MGTGGTEAPSLLPKEQRAITATANADGQCEYSYLTLQAPYSLTSRSGSPLAVAPQAIASPLWCLPCLALPPQTAGTGLSRQVWHASRVRREGEVGPRPITPPDAEAARPAASPNMPRTNQMP